MSSVFVFGPAKKWKSAKGAFVFIADTVSQCDDYWKALSSNHLGFWEADNDGLKDKAFVLQDKIDLGTQAEFRLVFTSYSVEKHEESSQVTE